MNKGYVQIYFGDGKGKTSAAIGKGIMEAGLGNNVIIIQFLKGKNKGELDIISKMEPQVKLFRFEKAETGFDELPEEMKTEEINNIRNGMNFAKKVLMTGECDVLILDEVLGLIDESIVSTEDIISIIRSKEEHVKLILTGIHLPDLITDYADEISRIEAMK